MQIRLGMFSGDCYEYVKEIQAESAQQKMRLICRKAQNIYRHAETITDTRTEIGKRNRFSDDDNFEIGGILLQYLATCFRYKNTDQFQVSLPIDCDLANLSTSTYRELHPRDRVELARIACIDVHYDHACHVWHLWNEFVEPEIEALFKDYPELVRWTVEAVTSSAGHLHVKYCEQKIGEYLNDLLSNLID